MSVVDDKIEITGHAPIQTWFGVGGGADLYAKPASIDVLRRCLAEHETVRVLGDGANLLVDDGGVDGLVVDLDTAAFRSVEVDAASGRVVAGAGANLPNLVNQTVRAGLAGLEVLAGIPASVGGAVVMNAGGKFGEIADSVRAVDGLDREGEQVRLPRDEIDFGYRRSGLNDLVVTSVEFALEPGDPGTVRDRLKECMAYKKHTQPLAADSAGCCFKNPTLADDLPDIGAGGSRVSAGLLIDRAGCKGLRVGGAEVSGEHANFIVTHDGACARDVITLMDLIAARVADRFGVALGREVVVWERSR
ncbi:MAG: UDP-N-acetylmuramate dehydrogenase [Phycisphaeraceae bacterium]|nr:MAG: UDP-N-acetylmuramate dehydrogenase [Phycisphaeraceae bacterium]